ncbi:MBOAT-domain-containing protein [Obba rivulosa]|uniref:MBOAT-domain-containing protein n=1 Tax=Obba rivulosa TaxID=1052685 RepID=A0A8E2J6R3_9APHY|nr:MBOAT-domain-containing protein [Obba rivulosa]
MDALFIPLAEAVGASVDQIKLITCLLVAYPLGSVFIRIPSSQPNLRHLFNLSITLIYLIPILNLWFGFLQLLADVIATYYIAKNARGPNMPWIVFAVAMGHLTVNHVIRAIYNLSYETFEITGPQMVLVMKLTTFAWNVWDGRRPVDDLDKWQLEKRVAAYPSLIAFLGYAFYFPGVLVGPSLEFADYMSLVEATQFKALEQTNGDANGKRRRIPKGRKRVAYVKMVKGLVYLGLFVTCIGSFNYGVAIQDWFAEKNFWYRIIYFQICGFFERSKYYAIWTLTEGASILTGLGFTGIGPSGETRWDGAANVNVPLIEFAPNFKVLLDSWNIKTNVWLRECVYKRVTPKGKKPGFRSSLITFGTSAFWHGIAGGYYLAFFFAAFIQTAGRLCRGYLRPLFLPASYVTSRGSPPPPQTPLKRAYDIAGIFCCILLVNYVAEPFILLTVSDSLHGWRNLNWYGQWMIGIALAFFYGGGTKVLKKFQAKRAKEAGVGEKVRVREQGAGQGAPVLPPLDDAAKELEKAEFLSALQKQRQN